MCKSVDFGESLPWPFEDYKLMQGLFEKQTETNSFIFALFKIGGLQFKAQKKFCAFFYAVLKIRNKCWQGFSIIV